MKRLLSVRILAVFLCFVLQASSVFYPVFAPSFSAHHTLAPFCQDLSEQITLPQRMGEAFEAVLVSALRHWGLLKGWIVQHSVDIPENHRTRPDLCFGASPASMLEHGKIVVEDIKLTRDPKYRYPDTFAKDKYTKFRYHYAALAIEAQNRERMIKSLESFCHWITRDGVRVAHNSPELKDWGRIWTVIGTRINRTYQKEEYSSEDTSYSLDDELFARSFRQFYDLMQYVIKTGQLVDFRTGEAMSIEQLSFTLTNALEAYAVRKEVRIIHPARLTIPPTQDKLFDGLSDEEKARFANVELCYANILTEWGHFIDRDTSGSIEQTLQFFIGMYLNLWDFNGDSGREKNIKRIRWTDREDEIVSFPLFRFGIKKKISRIESWFKTRNGAEIQLGRIIRGLRVGPRKRGVEPSAKTILAWGYNTRLSYFNKSNLEALAKETVRLFDRERTRLEAGGIKLESHDYIKIMADIVRQLGLHKLYIDTENKNISETAKECKRDFMLLVVDHWVGRKPRMLIKNLLKDAVAKVTEAQEKESAYYGNTIIRNEQLNKSKKLMRALGFAILKAETTPDWDGVIDLNGFEVEKKLIGSDIVKNFCKTFRARFSFTVSAGAMKKFVQRWQVAVLDEFEAKYMRSASQMRFDSIAQARMFLFYIGYLRDILLEDEVETTRNARLRKLSEESNYKARHLSVHGITMDYDTGEIVAPVIRQTGEYAEIRFANLGRCIRAYDHIIEKIAKEAVKIEPLLEKFHADEDNIRSDKQELTAFAQDVLALRKGEPKNAESIMIRDVAVWIIEACQTGDIDDENISMQVDVLVNLLESRFATLNGMRFTFITRSSAIHWAANGRFEKIEEIFDIVANSRDPLMKIDEMIRKLSKNTFVPSDVKELLAQVRAKLVAGLDRAGAVVVLSRYIERAELNKIDGYFFRYDEYVDTIAHIENWAASYLKPRIEEAA